MNTAGTLVRGVVIRTYVEGDALAPSPEGSQHRYDFCDVLVYTSMRGRRRGVLSRCLVLQQKTGLHYGDRWTPRASTGISIVTGQTIDLNAAVNPAELDGDHVLVGFMDNDPNLPVILGTLRHPNADVGNEGTDFGTVPTGTESDIRKYNGVLWGVASDGSFLVDARRGYSAAALTDSIEPFQSDLDTQQVGGHIDLRGRLTSVFSIGFYDEADPQWVLSIGSRFESENSDAPVAGADEIPFSGVGGSARPGLRLEHVTAGLCFDVSSAGATAKLELGTAEKSAAVAEYLDALFTAFRNDIMAKLSAHTHVIPSLSLNPTAPTTTVPNVTVASALLDLPEWNPLINSSQLKIPDTITE